jgi:hypothetical protein
MDQQRFPRVQIKSGKSIEVLSTLSEANCAADTRAYVAFMRHLKEVDGRNRTCLTIQMQYEVGVLGDSRDRSAAANAAFAGAAPKALMGYLGRNQAQLSSDLARRWARPSTRCRCSPTPGSCSPRTTGRATTRAAARSL